MKVTPLLRVAIHTEYDVVASRRRAHDIAAQLGFDQHDQTRVGTAVSEIARNAFNYALGGTVEFALEPLPSGRAALTITVTDSGPGIANLKQILAGKYKSKTGLGMGITGSRKLVDAFEIHSEPGNGTTVRITKELPARAPEPTADTIAALTKELSRHKPYGVLEELRSENEELLRVLDELRARQEELARLNNELEDTNRGVVALYAELDERAERLRRADQMKSRFLSHMSHEFRTPLTSILALTRLLQGGSDGELNPEQEKQVGFIRRSAEQLFDMVNDLLDLARVEAGKSVVRPARFTAASMFGGLRGVLKPLLTNEAVELVFEDPGDFPEFFTDDAKVSQILRNFVSNALKFTEQGQVRVSVSLLEDGQSASFAVSDTGIGIARENLDLVFEEFAQVDTPLHAKVKGTGLGLPLSKRLAELLGGAVRVESEPGKGSTFYLDIPLRYAGADAEPVETGGQIEFLLIDDEEVARYLVRQSLGGSASLAEAASGQEGLRRARKDKPGAILLDLRMPGMSGFEVLQELRGDPVTRHIPVVILTGKTLTSEERVRIQQHEAGLLSKEVLSLPGAGERIRAAVRAVSPSPERATAGPRRE